MKHKMVILLTMAAALFFASSCKKDRGILSTDSTNSADPKIMYLVANEWTVDPNGLWINLFRNVIPQGKSTNSKVYLIKDGNEIQLNHSVSFMGGQLWANSKGADVEIVFHYLLGELPFESLDINLAIQ